MVQSSVIAGIREKYQALSPLLHEKARRCWAACEALSLGYGGISLVAAATRLSRPTIRRGIAEIRAGDLGRDEPRATDARIRRPGGGRHSLAEADPRLLRDLKGLVDPATRGDPMSPLLWTCKSTRNLADALTERGHDISHQTVGRLLTELGYSLQSNRKAEEGRDHPDRDAQFEHINGRVRRYQRRGQPVISVDTKKKEIVGNYKNPGREREPKAQPRRVKSKDFPDKVLGKVSPYGIYDLTANEGWVNVGIDHDTAEFAVESIRRWWYRMGRAVYPGAKELLITADSGGSNGSRNRLWKVSLQELADETGLEIAVCHFPPGTSKWNKIEHRLFSFISQNWRGKPLVSHETIVNLIAATTTKTGLKVTCELDQCVYPSGIKISKKEMGEINLRRDAFHGEWNYTISPRTRK